MTLAYPIAGIDIAKDTHDLAVLSEDGSFKTRSIKGDAGSVHECAARLLKMGVRLVVLEATGGYEIAVMLALQDAGLDVARVNPMRVREFAKGIGQNSKTDREDACLLAIYGERVRPRAIGLPSETQRKLKALALRRRQLVDARAKEKMRLKQARDAAVRASIERLIAFLDEQIESVEKEIETLIENNAAMAEKCALVKSFPGIGNATACMILAELPELGAITHKQLNALVGVAPFNDDSAKRCGQRRIKGGRFDLRRALYMGAQTGYRHNPILKALYDRLREQGRPHKPALIACINKTLGILNAMVKQNAPFDADYAAG